MTFWIAAWVFVFALVTCLASLFGAEDWRDNVGLAGALIIIMAAAVFVMRSA